MIKVYINEIVYANLFCNLQFNWLIVERLVGKGYEKARFLAG